MEEKDISEAEELQLWQSLVAHAGWKRLERICGTQRALRMANVLGGMEDLRAEDRERGEYLGISLVLSTPETCITQLKVALDNAKGSE